MEYKQATIQLRMLLLVVRFEVSTAVTMMIIISQKMIIILLLVARQRGAPMKSLSRNYVTGFLWSVP
jgi:hypothetical protein